MPMLASLIGGRMPKDCHIDGKDIWPLIAGKEKYSPHEFLFHYHESKLFSIRYIPKEGKIFPICTPDTSLNQSHFIKIKLVRKMVWMEIHILAGNT